MKNGLYCFVLFSLLSSYQIFSQPKSFEGYAQFISEFTDEESEQVIKIDMDYYIKNDKFRVEIKSAEGTSVMLINKDHSYMLMPQANMYMEFPNAVAEPNEQNGEKEDKNELAAAKTGQKKNILGYECELYVFHEEDSDLEIWATDELGFFMFAASPMEQSQISNKYFSDGFFPLQILIKDKVGTGTGKVEVLKIEKQSVADNMFEIPAGYSKMTMPSYEMPGMTGDE